MIKSIKLLMKNQLTPFEALLVTAMNHLGHSSPFQQPRSLTNYCSTLQAALAIHCYEAHPAYLNTMIWQTWNQNLGFIKVSAMHKHSIVISTNPHYGTVFLRSISLGDWHSWQEEVMQNFFIRASVPFLFATKQHYKSMPLDCSVYRSAGP